MTHSGGPRRLRRILAAQLDGANRRLEGMRRMDPDGDVAGQIHRIRSIEEEILEHDSKHGPPPPEPGSGGLWGSNGPQRHGNDLYSSGSQT